MSVYRRIVAGMPGTPMPSSDWAYGEAAWHLVHFVREMSTPEQREAARMKGGTIRAVRVPRLPEGNGKEAWRGVPENRMTLMPLWWRNERIEAVRVQAAHDGERLALRLRWQDAVPEDAMLAHRAFADGAALQFSGESDPPLFAMGESGSPVNIWYWRSAWERDGTSGPPALAAAHPAMPDPERRFPGHPDLEGFATARAAGNPVAAKEHPSAVEDLSAEGFGTLTNQGRERQNVRGRGSRVKDGWAVVFVRALRPEEEGDVRLDDGGRVSAAIWDGGAGDRNGQKSVSIWHELVIER